MSPAVYNSEYDPNGYYYDVEVPESRPSTLRIELYDPAYNSTGTGSCGASPDNPLGVSGTSITTTFNLYYAPRPLDHGADQLVATKTYSTDDPASCGQWVPLSTLDPAAPSGLYRVQVFTEADEPNSIGTNAFGIRAGYEGTWARCTTVSGDPNYSPSCPQVHGENAVSVFANQAGSSATFYLAKVDSVYLGKKLNVQLFDPGEGAKTIEILDPQGNPVNFSYSTVDDNTGKPDSAFTKGFLPYSGTGTSLDLQGTITPPPGFASFYKFSDRHLLLQTTISKSGWYKIRYTTNAGGVTDRTTWSVTVLANPVHLVPNG